MSDVAAELIVDVTARESVTAVLQRLESQLQRSDATATRVAAALESRLARAQTRTASAALQHAQALARLQAASGDLVSAAFTLSSAIGQEGARTTAVIRAETQLAGVRRQLTQQTAATLTTNRSLTSSLLQLAGPLGVATTGVGALIAVLGKVKDGFVLQATLDEQRRSLGALYGDVQRGDAVFNEAIAFGKQYGFTQKEMGQAASDAALLIQRSTVSTGQLLQTLAKLTTLNPTQGIAGAALALKELQSGDITSIVERFNLSRSAANEMKAAIQGGGDAVQVLDAQLTKMGITAAVLKQRTEGAAGATRTYAQAQESLSLALGRLAEGPGVKAISFLAQFTDTLTSLASHGDVFASQRAGGAAIEAQLVATATSYEDYTNRVVQAQDQITQAFAGNPIGAMAARSIASLGQLTPAQLQYAQALIQTGTAATDAVATAQGVSDVAQLLATQLQAVGGAGTATGAVLSQVGGQLLQVASTGQEGAAAALTLAGSFAAGEISAEQLRIVLDAQIASQQAQAQAAQQGAVAAQQAAAAEAFRMSEHQAGTSVTGGHTLALRANTQALIDQIQQSQQATVQNQALHAAEDLLAQIGQQVASGQQTAAQGALAFANAAQIAYDEALNLVNAQAQLARASVSEDRAERDTAADRAKVKSDQALAANQKLLAGLNAQHRAAGATRLSDQERLNNQLLTSDTRYQQQVEDAEAQHAQKVLSIEAAFQRKSLEQQRANEVAKRASRASFYDSLTQATKTIGPKEAQALSAEYEAAYAKAQQIAQSGQQKLAADYLALKQQQIQQETQYQAALAEAKKQGDDAEIARLQQIQQLRAEANAQEEQQLLAGGDANVNDRQGALDQEAAAYDAQQQKLATASDRATDRLVTNAQRAGKAMDEALIPPLERAAALTDRLGGSAGGTGAAPGTPAGTTSAATASDPNAQNPIAAPIVEALSAVAQAIVDAIQAATASETAAIGRAAETITSAVKGIRLTTSSAGGIS